MSDHWFHRSNVELGKTILKDIVGIIAVLVALAGAIVVGRFISANGVLSIGLITLSLAMVLSLLGSLWLRPLVYVGLTLAWLAMTIVFVERSIAVGLNGWGATAVWVLANLWAATVYTNVETKLRPDDTRRRSLVFYGLFIAWPATALLVIGRGNELGLSGWVSIGGWAAASFIVPLAYLEATDDTPAAEVQEGQS